MNRDFLEKYLWVPVMPYRNNMFGQSCLGDIWHGVGREMANRQFMILNQAENALWRQFVND